MSVAPLAEVAARVRAATLASWADHPVRFREDANAEEDHGAGWYRDRVVVELAQNAADAAHAAGGRGSLLLALDSARGTLVAANTGLPLDADGLTSLASLRASAKRGSAAVGRFGVGFAAVRSVADEVAVVSTSGAVHFSSARTAAALAQLPGLTDEVERRAGSLPVLRLPFDGPGSADPHVLDGGWDTAVVLHLRDDAAVRSVADQLAALDDALLLALPGLASVRVEVDGSARTLADVEDRWLVVSASGELDAGLLADRPVEERERTGWQVSWAVPTAAGGPGAAQVLHAPTPTDDALTVPALLLGTFPLDPGRRRVTPGPVTDALVAEAGRLWPRLLLAVRRAREAGVAAPEPLDLLPTGFPAGPLDDALRRAVLDASRDVPVLPTVAGWVTARDGLTLAPPWDTTDAAHVLGSWFGSLVTLGPDRREVLRMLDVPVAGVAELVEQLPATEPARLREVYQVLARHGADELGAAPVPLADGRVVHGARGAVMVDDVPLGPLTTMVGWGLRVVHPDAAHPVLERIGAQRATAAELAVHPVLRDRVLDGDPDAAEVLLALLEAAGPAVAARPSWWGEALLVADDGEPTPARGLVAPGSPAAGWFDPDVLPPVARDLADRWGGTLVVAGVRAGLVVEPVDELVADLLEDWPDYLAATGVDDDGSLLAVVDLDAVRDWPGVLAALAEHPEALTPVRDRDGGLAPSYPVWRLRGEPALGAGRPFALPGADRSAGVLAHLDPPAAVLSGVPEPLLRALGGVAAATELTAAGWAVLVDDLEPGDAVPIDLAVDCWRALATLVAGGLGELAEVAVLPGWDGSAAVAARVDDLAVADPMWRRHPAAWPVLPVPAGLADAIADALDLDLAADRAAGRVGTGGSPAELPQALRGVLPGLPGSWVRHERLLVDGVGLDWWLDGGVVHATDTGLAAGLAALTGAPGDLLDGLLSGRLDRSAALLALLDRRPPPGR